MLASDIVVVDSSLGLLALFNYLVLMTYYEVNLDLQAVEFHNIWKDQVHYASLGQQDDKVGKEVYINNWVVETDRACSYLGTSATLINNHLFMIANIIEFI